MARVEAVTWQTARENENEPIFNFTELGKYIKLESRARREACATLLGREYVGEIERN